MSDWNAAAALAVEVGPDLGDLQPAISTLEAIALRDRPVRPASFCRKDGEHVAVVGLVQQRLDLDRVEVGVVADLDDRVLDPTDLRLVGGGIQAPMLFIAVESRWSSKSSIVRLMSRWPRRSSVPLGEVSRFSCLALPAASTASFGW